MLIKKKKLMMYSNFKVVFQILIITCNGAIDVLCSSTACKNKNIKNYLKIAVHSLGDKSQN